MTNDQTPNTDAAASAAMDAATTTITGASVADAAACRTKACGMAGAFGKVPLILAAIAGLGFAGFQGYSNRAEWAAAISGEPLPTAMCGRVGGACCTHKLPTETETEVPQVASAGLPEFGTCCSMLPGAVLAAAELAADEPVSALVPLNVDSAASVEIAEPASVGLDGGAGVAL